MQVKIESKIVSLSIDFHNQLPPGQVNIWQPLFPSQISVKAEGEWLRNVEIVLAVIFQSILEALVTTNVSLVKFCGCSWRLHSICWNIKHGESTMHPWVDFLRFR